MLRFVEDESRYNAFLEPITLHSRTASVGVADALDLKLMECFQGDPRGHFAEETTVSGLGRRPKAALRVIFAPPDVPKTSNWNGLCTLFDYLDVPSSFLSERVQSVACSFGSRSKLDAEHSLWFHFLCKNVQLTPDIKIKNVVGDGPAGKLSQADWSWHKAGFFLKWTDRLLKDASEDTPSRPATNTPRFDNVTLCCWGAPHSIVERFADIVRTPHWFDALYDPFVLLDVILDQLYLLLDEQKNNIRAAFGQIETDTLLLAAKQSSRRVDFDFVGLANLTKHNLNLGTDAALHIVEAAQRHHAKYFERYAGASQNRVVHAVEDALDHKAVLFRSIDMQARSRDRRMQTLTNLAYNLVAQQSNRAVIDDSRSMRTIAAIGLVFLPFASIAALFSTPFFFNAPDSTVKVSGDFWVFWAVAIPLTLSVIAIWSLLYFRAKENDNKGSEIMSWWPSWPVITKRRSIQQDIEMV